jgi:plastocyanin
MSVTLSRRVAGLTAAVVAVAGLLAACSDDSPDSSSGSSGGDGGGGDGVTIEVTAHDGEVSPLGDTVQVGAGEEVTLLVDSDIADEYHVHSDPEQEFEVAAAEDQKFSFSIDTPGTYEVESHELGVTIVKLEVG